MGSLRAIIGLLLLLLLNSGTASAATVDQIIQLSRSGVSDAVILAVIARDKTIFSIEPEQLLKLQQDGLSEPVILAMLKSGRAEAEAAANAETAMNAAWFLATASAPDVLIVGASEAEKQAERERSAWNDRPVTTLLVPYPVAVPIGVPFPHSRCITTPTAGPLQASSTRGIFFSQPTSGIFFSPSVVTDCQGATTTVPRR